MNRLYLTYSKMNTEDIKELLEWLMSNHIIMIRDDGSYYFRLNNKIVGEVRHMIESYTLTQFNRANFYTDDNVTYRGRWHGTTNWGKDETFMMEFQDRDEHMRIVE